MERDQFIANYVRRFLYWFNAEGRGGSLQEHAATTAATVYAAHPNADPVACADAEVDRLSRMPD